MDQSRARRLTSMQFLRRWRPRHLLLAWITYWLGLALVTLGPVIPAIIRATRLDAQGNITAGMGDEGLTLTVMAQGSTIWQGSTSLLSLALWVLAPPFILWAAWLAQRPKRSDDALTSREVAALREPAADFAVRTPVREVERRE